MAKFVLRYFFAKDHFIYEEVEASSEREAAAVATRKLTSGGENTVIVHSEGRNVVVRKEAILYCEVWPGKSD